MTNSTIDWNGKLEAVHDDGEVWPDPDGDYHVGDHAGRLIGFFRADGQHVGGGWSGDGWTIRNAKHAPEAPQEPPQSDLGAEGSRGGVEAPNASWGPEIAVDGKRPAWLGDGDVIWPKWPLWSSLRAGVNVSQISPTMWEDTVAIKLPADHFAYKALAAGFEPWGGGDAAPVDWDGGEVLCRDGNAGSGTRWFHASASVSSTASKDRDIIGYRKRASPLKEYLASVKESLLSKSFKSTEGSFDPAPHLATYDPETHVAVERMSHAEAMRWADLRWGPMSNTYDVLETLGVIKPDTTPLSRFLAEHPAADRETAEMVLRWVGEGE